MQENTHARKKGSGMSNTTVQLFKEHQQLFTEHASVSQLLTRHQARTDEQLRRLLQAQKKQTERSQRRFVLFAIFAILNLIITSWGTIVAMIMLTEGEKGAKEASAMFSEARTDISQQLLDAMPLVTQQINDILDTKMSTLVHLMMSGRANN